VALVLGALQDDRIRAMSGSDVAFQDDTQSGSDLKERKWIMVGSDDDLELPVSIFLEFGEQKDEVVDAVKELIGAYGFTEISEFTEASGSFLGWLKARFKSTNRTEARKGKEELKKDLLSAVPPKEPQRQSAIVQFKKVMKKTGLALVLAGRLLVAHPEPLEEGAKMVVSAVIGHEVEKLLSHPDEKKTRKKNHLVIRDLPPEESYRFHEKLRNEIDQRKQTGKT